MGRGEGGTYGMTKLKPSTEFKRTHPSVVVDSPLVVMVDG